MIKDVLCPWCEYEDKIFCKECDGIIGFKQNIHTNIKTIDCFQKLAKRGVNLFSNIELKLKKVYSCDDFERDKYINDIKDAISEIGQLAFWFDNPNIVQEKQGLIPLPYLQIRYNETKKEKEND